MTKRRGTGINFASEMALLGNSDGAKALSTWSNYGRIMTPGVSLKSRSQRTRHAPQRRKVKSNGDKLG
jgi:hypothetical protein